MGYIWGLNNKKIKEKAVGMAINADNINEINTVVNNTVQYVNDMTKLEGFTKYTLNVELNKDLYINMQDKLAEPGTYLFVVRTIGAADYAWSFAHVHYPGTFTTQGANFEFAGTRGLNGNTEIRVSFQITGDKHLRYWTNWTSAKIEVLVRKIGTLEGV